MGMSGAVIDYPFGESTAVYKIHDKMFALIAENKIPVRISLKCDPQLSKVLQEKYETVMPGYHLNKKHWITVVLTGQLPLDEVKGLITHSYSLVTGDAKSQLGFILAEQSGGVIKQFRKSILEFFA